MWVLQRSRMDALLLAIIIGHTFSGFSRRHGVLPRNKGRVWRLVVHILSVLLFFDDIQHIRFVQQLPVWLHKKITLYKGSSGSSSIRNLGYFICMLMLPPAGVYSVYSGGPFRSSISIHTERFIRSSNISFGSLTAYNAAAHFLHHV